MKAAPPTITTGVYQANGYDLIMRYVNEDACILYYRRNKEKQNEYMFHTYLDVYCHQVLGLSVPPRMLQELDA